MQSMIFQVSAKTARLIGRENISDVNGAIIELIKNGYDADAECVYVKFVNPYNEIPQTLTQSEVKKFFKQRMDLIENNYTIFDGKYNLNKIEKCGLYSDLGQFTRNYTQTVKRAADNKRRYAPGEGSIPPVLLSGVSKGVPPLAHDFACKV